MSEKPSGGITNHVPKQQGCCGHSHDSRKNPYFLSRKNPPYNSFQGCKLVPTSLITNCVFIRERENDGIKG